MGISKTMIKVRSGGKPIICWFSLIRFGPAPSRWQKILDHIPHLMPVQLWLVLLYEGNPQYFFVQTMKSYRVLSAVLKETPRRQHLAQPQRPKERMPVKGKEDEENHPDTFLETTHG